MLSAAKAEKLGNFGSYSGHDGGVKQRIQSRKEKRADDNSDKNLNAGIDIAFGLFIGDCAFGGNDCGIYLVSDFLKHIFYLVFSFDFWCITD